MKRISVYEMADEAVVGLTFTDGDIALSINAIISKYRGYLVVREGKDGWVVDNDESNREFLFEEIIRVPEAREKFAESLCESIVENRQEHEEYNSLLETWKHLRCAIEEVEEKIYSIDSELATFSPDIEDLIDWSPDKVTPGEFTRSIELERIDPEEAIRRRRVERQWKSNIYFGPSIFQYNGSALHNLSLHFNPSDSIWTIETSDNVRFKGHSVLEATKEMCEHMGIKPIRTYRDLRMLWRDKPYELNYMEFDFVRVA